MVAAAASCLRELHVGCEVHLDSLGEHLARLQAVRRLHLDRVFAMDRACLALLARLPCLTTLHLDFGTEWWLTSGQ